MEQERTNAPAETRRSDGPPRRTDQPRFRKGGMPFFKKKFCAFCTGQLRDVTYKNTDILRRFVSDQGKILPRRVTGTCAKHQRRVAVEVKKARILALFPFTAR